MATSRTFELRTYHSAEGRLEALSARFRDHTLALFSRHGIDVIGFWSAPATDDPTTGALVYVCAYASRPAADTAWSGFRDDPDWHRVRDESEQDGPLVTTVESLFMVATEYSALQ